MSFFVVFLGGGFGALARYGLAVALAGIPGFPWAAFVANVAGSFVMGLAVDMAARGFVTSPGLRLFLTTVILGGFTTLSAFSLDSAVLMQERLWLLAALYAGGSVILSVAALFAGLALARVVAP